MGRLKDEMLTDEYEEGHRAGSSGAGLDTCPYPDDPTKRYRWEAGHHNGRYQDYD